MQVKQINDSRLVGMSIYNVAILCIITAPVTMAIADQQNATFAFVALANVFCCYLSMALVFVPKVCIIGTNPNIRIFYFRLFSLSNIQDMIQEKEKMRMKRRSRNKK